jgi:hypothetical protein
LPATAHSGSVNLLLPPSFSPILWIVDSFSFLIKFNLTNIQFHKFPARRVVPDSLMFPRCHACMNPITSTVLCPRLEAHNFHCSWPLDTNLQDSRVSQQNS